MTPERIALRCGTLVLLAAEMAAAGMFQTRSGRQSDQTEARIEQLTVLLNRNFGDAIAMRTNKPPHGPERPAAASSRPRMFIDRFTTALSDQEFLRLLDAQQQALLDVTHAEIFRQLALSDAELDQLKGLVAQRQLARTRVEKNASEVRSDEMREIDERIRQLLGDSRLEKLAHFEETAPARHCVEQLRFALDCTPSPLKAVQADQLVDAWYNALPAAQKGHAEEPPAEIGSGLSPLAERESAFPASAVQVARPILLPEQLTVLERMVSVQKAERRLSRLANGPQS